MTRAKGMPWPSPRVPRSPGKGDRSQDGPSDLVVISNGLSSYSLVFRIVLLKVEEGKDLVLPQKAGVGLGGGETKMRGEREGEAPGKLGG